MLNPTQLCVVEDVCLERVWADKVKRETLGPQYIIIPKNLCAVKDVLLERVWAD